MENLAILLCTTLVFGVASISAQTSEVDILDYLSNDGEEETSVNDFLDTLQLKESLVTVNCRLSCSLSDYKRTCGCVKAQCTMWKNSCVALCNGARVMGYKEDHECKALSGQQVEAVENSS